MRGCFVLRLLRGIPIICVGGCFFLQSKTSNYFGITLCVANMFIVAQGPHQRPGRNGKGSF
jgi:hypothetical protein